MSTKDNFNTIIDDRTRHGQVGNMATHLSKKLIWLDYFECGWNNLKNNKTKEKFCKNADVSKH